MALRLGHLGLVIAAAALSGCGGVFDELDRAAEIQNQWHADEQAVAQTDYAQACHTYGCGNGTPASNPRGGSNTGSGRPSGCPYATPDGQHHTGGTACPQ